MSEKIEINKIKTDGGTQPRASLNKIVVAEYIAAMQRGDAFPPISVYHDGSVYWLADGFHRVAAHREAHGTAVAILADVKQGTQRDAILQSVGENAAHGYPRSRADKQRAILRLLEDEEWGQWSDREIARRCRVSHPTVATLRKTVTGKFTSGERVYERNGKTAVMQTGKIGSSVMTPRAMDTDAGTRSIGEIATEIHEKDLRDLSYRFQGWLIGVRVNNVRGQLEVAQEFVNLGKKHPRWGDMVSGLEWESGLNVKSNYSDAWTLVDMMAAIQMHLDFLIGDVAERQVEETAVVSDIDRLITDTDIARFFDVDTYQSFTDKQFVYLIRAVGEHENHYIRTSGLSLYMDKNGLIGAESLIGKLILRVADGFESGGLIRYGKRFSSTAVLENHLISFTKSEKVTGFNTFCTLLDDRNVNFHAADALAVYNVRESASVTDGVGEVEETAVSDITISQDHKERIEWLESTVVIVTGMMRDLNVNDETEREFLLKLSKIATAINTAIA